MKYFDWNTLKNQKLKKERHISFEEVVSAIKDGQILDIVTHPNKEKYPKQFIFIININEYAYLVPFVEDNKKYFLKTIFPNRDATEKYILKKRKNYEKK